MDLYKLISEKTERLLNTDYKQRLVSLLSRRPVVAAAEADYDKENFMLICRLLKENGINPGVCRYEIVYNKDCPGMIDMFIYDGKIMEFGPDINVIACSRQPLDSSIFTGSVCNLPDSGKISSYACAYVINTLTGTDAPAHNIAEYAESAARAASDMIKEYKNELMRTLRALDERSGHIFLSILAIRTSPELSSKPYPHLPIYEPNQYFPSFIRLSDSEYLIDGGAYNGDTAAEFIKRTGNKYKGIAAFEPDAYTFARLEAYAGNMPGITLYNCGLYDTAGTQHFTSANTASRITDEPPADNSAVISTITGDELNLAPTYIKLDIEGAELKALKGLSQTITRHRPKLAVCVYHKPRDIFELPLYVIDTHPGYKLYLRHHALNDQETVLYAVPQP